MKSSIFVFVIVLTSQAFVQGAIVSDPPRNVTAVVGQNVTLTCQVEIGEGERDALNWEKITPGSSSTYIFKSIDPPEKTSNPNKYQIFGTFNLRILNVDVSDGGLYSCYLYLDSNTKYTANVIVLGQPNLEVAEQVNEGDQTTARCSAQFGSQPLKLLDKALLPHISLQVGQDVIVSNNTYTTVDLTNIVTAVSTSARFYGHHNEKDVRCVVKSSFRPYVSVYASQTIFVIYPARDISFDSVKPFYKVGDIIRCRANGRPSPSLRWVSVNTSQPIEGGLLAVTSNMVARKNIWNCTAWNTIGNVTYTVSNVATFSATSQGGSFRTTEFSIFSIAFCVYYFLN